jgi:hypothetical protein
MLTRFVALTGLVVVLSALALPNVVAEEATAGIELKSSGPLAFGPKGVLFVGDPLAATVYAIETNEAPTTSKDKPKVEGITDKLAEMLGTKSNDVQIKDLAVNPASGTTYLSVARGKNSLLVTVSREGKLAEFSLKGAKFTKTTLDKAVEGKQRMEAITHLAFVKDRLMVAGLSNEEFASKLRSIPYPFDKTDKGSNIEIFHGAHGKFETRSPIRVFTSYKIGDEENILAAYTCTPLVRLPVSGLEPGKKVVATTLAELGNRNRPLSMIVYKKGGKDFVLLANSARGLMKIPLEGIEKIEGITKPVSGTAGLKYETIRKENDVQKLDAFDADNAIIYVKTADGKTKLETIELP